MKKRKQKSNYKPLAGLFLALLAVSIIIAVIIGIAKNSNFFRVREVVVQGNSADLSYLVGRNIFSIDLAQQEDFVSRNYPGYEKIRLVKVFPDKIFAQFLKREPLAYVKLFRYFYVDQNAVIFTMPELEKQPELPVIYGLENKISNPKNGDKCEIRELITALYIIKSIEANPKFALLKIVKVDVPKLQETAIFFSLDSDNKNTIEVKIGQEYVIDKINILSSLLNADKDYLSTIKYIDLRFKEPVIKYKDKKK